MVQSRLPGAAPHRLVDAGDRAGEDHPLRGGASDPRLGRSAPAHRSARPALLRVLPSGAQRRAADLRRGRVHERHSGRDRADPRQGRRHDRAGTRQHRGVLFDLELPARACGRELRQLPDQAGGGGGLARVPAPLDLRDAFAGARFRRLARARAPVRNPILLPEDLAALSRARRTGLVAGRRGRAAARAAACVRPRPIS